MTSRPTQHMVEQTVTIQNEPTVLGGFLGLSFTASGIVLFAHGNRVMACSHNGESRTHEFDCGNLSRYFL